MNLSERCQEAREILTRILPFIPKEREQDAGRLLAALDGVADGEKVSAITRSQAIAAADRIARWCLTQTPMEGQALAAGVKQTFGVRTA